MGKGLKKFEKKAKQARDYGKKVYPAAEKAWAIAAPQNHDQYAPKLAKGYKTFNTQANKLGGWGTVDKAADALQAVGLLVLVAETEDKNTKEYVCNLDNIISSLPEATNAAEEIMLKHAIKER